MPSSDSRTETSAGADQVEAQYHDQENDQSADDDDASSTFTEANMEGPASFRGIELSKTTSRRIERTQTAVSQALSIARSRNQHVAFSHPLAREKTSKDVIVRFDGPTDPYRPMNWTFRKKATTTMLYSITTMTVTLASSIFAPAVSLVAKEYHVGHEVATLGLSLLLFGFGLGPLLWAPLSELYGRRNAVLVPTFVSMIFAFGCGAAKDIQTIMITRFFQGFFGAAPITNTGGVLGDIWSADQRGVATVVYALGVLGGPTLGPVIGAAICDSSIGWRWTQYVTGMFQAAVLSLDILVLDESYPDALLVDKARRLRYETGNWALHAEHEEWNISLYELGHKYLIRPFQLLLTPICFSVALYASFVYSLLYASLGAFPYVFENSRGWNKLVGALPFLAMLVGIFLGAAGNILNQKFYVKRWRENRCRPVPEARLPPMMAGSFIFASGIFIFAWTGGKRDVFWLAPCIGIVLIGVGFFTIFQSALGYLIDTFQRYAASAVAAQTFLRSMMAGAFPLFIRPALVTLGVGWGMSVFGFFAVLLMPIPFLFWVFGKRIRAKGALSKESAAD